MSRLFALVFALVAVIAAATPAAAAFTFGDEESLHKIQDVEIVGAENEALSLGYKTTTKNILLPYTLEDNGYVLVVRDNTSKFYTMTPEEIAQWQEAGLLPDPLPSYEIGLFDRIMGHLLWPTLVVIAIVYALQWRGAQKKKAAAAAAASPAVTPPPGSAA